MERTRSSFTMYKRNANLKCKRCNKKTRHRLILKNDPIGVKNIYFECCKCGQSKEYPYGEFLEYKNRIDFKDAKK